MNLYHFNVGEEELFLVALVGFLFDQLYVSSPSLVVNHRLSGLSVRTLCSLQAFVDFNLRNLIFDLWERNNQLRFETITHRCWRPSLSTRPIMQLPKPRNNQKQIPPVETGAFACFGIMRELGGIIYDII